MLSETLSNMAHTLRLRAARCNGCLVLDPSTTTSVLDNLRDLAEQAEAYERTALTPHQSGCKVIRLADARQARRPTRPDDGGWTP